MAFLVAYAIEAAISAGVSYLAYLLTKPKRAKPPYDATPTTLSRSGTPIPLVIGTRRIPPVVGSAFNRISYVGSSGRHYFEGRWDQLCVGPAFRLLRIRQADKVIWEGPISREDTPSGTTVQFDDGPGEQGGSWFRIYWGECDQNGAPPDVDLQQYLGVASIWPTLCHVVWGRKALGFSPQWPQLDYEIEVRVESATPTLEDSDPYMPATVLQVGNDGANPAHAIWMMATAAFPHGVNLPMAFLSSAGFEELGTVCATEQLPCNMEIAGEDCNDVVAQFMQDVGFYLPHEAGRLRPRIIRPVAIGGATYIPPDMIVDADVEEEYLRSPLTPDRIMFHFADRNQLYTTREMVWDSDGSIRAQAPKQQSFDMPYITDRRTAQTVITRRLMEVSTKGQVFKFKVDRAGRRLVPGQSVIVGDLGQCLVQSIGIRTDSGEASVEAIRDQFSYGFSTYVPENVDEVGDQLSADVEGA
jgi:hypothetical protein